jgi:hypothetical protein
MWNICYYMGWSYWPNKKSIFGAYYNEWARKVNKQKFQKKMELEDKKLEMELWN